MVKSIDAKRFFCDQQSNKFYSIVPIFDNYLKNEKPINHIKIQGLYVPIANSNDELAEWHPDNPFSSQKYIECHIHICKWIVNTHKEYVLDHRYRTGWHGQECWTRFFVPAEQLKPLHWTVDKEYRSKDRELENYGTSILIEREYATWG